MLFIWKWRQREYTLGKILAIESSVSWAFQSEETAYENLERQTDKEAKWGRMKTHRTKNTDKTTSDYVEYEWDHRNHLVTVTFRNSSDAKTKEVTYDYDAFDRRIAKHVDTDGNGTVDSSENYVYDGSEKGDKRRPYRRK